MALNPAIILGGQQFDLAGAMQTGLDMAARQKQFDQQNALADLYKTQGANILAGDQNALNALAGFDPAAAMGIQSQRQSMAYQTEDQEMQRAAAQREAERYAKEVGAEKAAADAAELRANTMQALAAPTPEAFDAMMVANGRPDMVGQWENREMLAIPYLELADALDMIAPKAPEMTASQKDYKFYSDQETAAGRKPLSFNEWDLQSRKAGATNVTTTVGGPTKAETAAHNKTVKADNVNQVIDDILATNKNATLPTTGFVGDVLSNIGGTAAGDIAANLNTLRAAASFGSLQAMREASPTGGALGAVSDTEIKLLNSELAALEQSQSEEQFFRNLERFRKVYNEIVHGPGGAPPAEGGDMSDEDLLRIYGGE